LENCCYLVIEMNEFDMTRMFFKLLELSGKEKTKDEIVDVANIHDYFMFKTLDAIKDRDKEQAKKLVNLFTHLEAISDKHNNQFYVGFFFTLSQLLSLEFRIKMFTNEKIDRESFEQSFEETKQRYGW